MPGRTGPRDRTISATESEFGGRGSGFEVPRGSSVRLHGEVSSATSIATLAVADGPRHRLLPDARGSRSGGRRPALHHRGDRDPRAAVRTAVRRASPRGNWSRSISPASRTYEDRINAISREPARARGGRRARSRARAGQGARAAARHSRSRSRTTSTRRICRRPAARSRLRGYRAALRGDADEEPARRRRDHHRQDRADRAGQLGRRRTDADARQLQRASAASRSIRTIRGRDPRADTSDGRPVLQTGGSSSGIGTAANFWAANVGTDTGGSVISPSNAEHARRHPADHRAHQPLRRDPDHRRSRHGGADGRTVTDAAIMMGALESAGAGSERPGDADVHAAAGSRLHQVPATRRAERRAHRHPARVLSTTRITAPGDESTGRAAALNAEQAQGDGRRDRDAEARRAPIVIDPGRHARASSTRIRTTNFLLCDFCSGAEHAKGRDASCSVNFKYGMKRDFNAWLATLGTVGAGQDADRAARVEHRAREARAPSGTGSRGSTSPTRWTSSRSRTLRGGHAPRTVASAATRASTPC